MTTIRDQWKTFHRARRLMKGHGKRQAEALRENPDIPEMVRNRLIDQIIFPPMVWPQPTLAKAMGWTTTIFPLKSAEALTSTMKAGETT